MGTLTKAFLLGAGLGTRLRPLTETLPKPLVPLWNRPLLTFAMDHLIHDLGVESFAVNTHHCPDAYAEAFPDSAYAGRSILFRHEPILLDTGGGIDNLRDWLPKEEAFLVYNADILTDLSLSRLLKRHKQAGNLVTMALRSTGSELRVGFDPESGQIVDLRGQLQPDWPIRCQFAGIYVVSPRFLDYLSMGKIESVVITLLRAIQAGERIGGIVLDEGSWSDLGTRDSYLDALAPLASGHPSYPTATGEPRERISPQSRIGDGVQWDDLSSVGAGAILGAGARLRESIIWPGGIVAPEAELHRVVVRSGQTASGQCLGVDL